MPARLFGIGFLNWLEFPQFLNMSHGTRILILTPTMTMSFAI